MIHLDSNFLIRAADRNSPVETTLQDWLRQDETFAASSIAWAEFLNGPVRPDHVRKMDNFIQGRIIPFGRAEAQVASMLFNETGRKRGSQPDCFIAATAICLRAPLATFNQKDFAAFVPLGLRLA
jgi:predicted nucleic acid-binding protein